MNNQQAVIKLYLSLILSLCVSLSHAFRQTSQMLPSQARDYKETMETKAVSKVKRICLA